MPNLVLRARLKTPVYVKGYQGIGDQLYQRPVIRAALRKHTTVYLETPMPQLYWDMVSGDNLQFVKPFSQFRHAKESIAKTEAGVWVNPPISLASRSIWYDYMDGLNPLRSFAAKLGVEPDPDFDLPIHPDWKAAARKFLKDQKLEGQPIAFVRPNTLRVEWPCASRNCKVEYLHRLVTRYQKDFHWITLANVLEGQEWLEGGGAAVSGSRLEFLKGEVPVTTFFALMREPETRAIVAGPSFWLCAGAATKVPTLILFGGNVPPNLLIDPTMIHDRFKSIAPDLFCPCMKDNHECRKDIPFEKIVRTFEQVIEKRPVEEVDVIAPAESVVLTDSPTKPEPPPVEPKVVAPATPPPAPVQQPIPRERPVEYKSFEELVPIVASGNDAVRKLFRDKLIWWPQIGIGYLPVYTPDMYGEEYWEEYRRRAATEIGRKLHEKRVALVAKYVRERPVLDVGIGSGQFIEMRRATTYGFDVNPHAIGWLKARQLWLDLYADPRPMDNVTSWDSIEHIPNPERLVEKVGEYLFISIPIFKNVEHVLKSKHFKPGEHLFYFTEIGLVHFMEVLGFELLEKNRMEEEVGREDIGTFVFRRAGTQS